MVAVADTEASAVRVRQLLRDHDTGAEVVVGPLERGAVFPAIGLAVLAEADLTGRRRTHRAPRQRRRDAERFFDDLAVGDYVVHHQHGVARYGGMVKRAIAGVERDYLLLEYRGDDKLYVPSDQIDAVRHYTGGEEPTLTKLGGDGWAKTKARVRAAVREIAQELVVLYQKRVSSPGHAFPADTPWQQEMEDAFPFAETPDQLKAIDDVKADLESGRPMDRLVCGDVGFGKTEVAIRAVFKAVQDGKQAAVLVPTTLLAQQHFQTFADRFAGFPVQGRGALPLPHARAGQVRGRRARQRRGRCRDRHPPPPLRGHRVQGPGTARRRRGATLRRHPQGDASRRSATTSTCSPSRPRRSPARSR